jgi:protein ImuB
LLHERLARTVLPAPVRAIRLASGPLVELPEAPRELFAVDRRASGTALPPLVERLRARLGVEAVHGLCLVPEHRPESAWRVSEPLSQEGRRPVVRRVAPGEAARPLWLLPEPQPYAGPLAIEDGPERIESGWWDGRDVARDYYVARNPAGVRLWVFRERRRAAAAGGAEWFLHGFFG